MKANNFQITVIIVFMTLAIFGVLVFSGAIPLGDKNAPGSQGTVVLWGTVNATVMAPILQEFNNANPSFVVQYSQKSADTFSQDLLEALAVGAGPDIFFLSDDMAFHYANKIVTIPYNSYPSATFKRNFVGAGEVFMTSRGILAFPLSVDPLMMYYNRSILDSNGIVHPPEFWDELSALAPKLTKRDSSNRITKSAVALGHFSNIAHTKDILATLFMQTGNGIVSERNGVFNSSLSASVAGQQQSPETALKFYTDFADPNRDVYSWNRSFSNSSEAFSKEELAFYFGYASEVRSLIGRNPNQNFFVAPVPQVRGGNLKTTASRVTGIAILSSSKNFNAAFAAASLMSAGNFASRFAAATGTVPARRDLLVTKPQDSFSSIFYDSALYARSWLDPSPKDTDNIFRSMIDGVLSNSMTPRNAVSDASAKLDLLLLK